MSDSRIPDKPDLAALFGALIVSLTSTVASWYVGPDGRYQVLIIERRQ